MEKRKWLWKRKSSERSPGDSESSGSFSSHSERYSDEQDVLKESPQDSTQSPEVTSKAMLTDSEMTESIKCLTEKLSAALVNVSAKEDLVKQHSKVAEEAVAGWEKAENEVTALKQQLEAAVQQNLNLEVRASHLDGALKECVRQLRQSKDEQERRISKAVSDKSQEFESAKSKLEKRIIELQAEVKFVKDEKSSSVNPNNVLKLEALERENSTLKQQMVSLSTEFEIMTVERDLSIQAAETASKMQLESIKKLAKVESECRRLQIRARKSSPNQKSVANNSSVYADSLTDSHSGCSDSWATALIAELDTFKNEKQHVSSHLVTAPSIEIDMMDDFLEMERLVALPETKVNTPAAISESASGECASTNNSLKAELDMMTQHVAELENKLENVEAEKLELEKSLENVEAEKLELENKLENVEAEKLELEKSLENVEVEKLELEKSLDDNESSLKEAYERISISESKMEELQKKLIAVCEAKDLLESQLIGMEVEARTMSANVDALKVEIEKERKLSVEQEVKCQELENKLVLMVQESELQQNTNSNAELKLKQEDLAVAADKLAECQKTIASLGLQLKSLATLEDFLIDTSNIPGLSRMSRENGSHLEN